MYHVTNISNDSKLDFMLSCIGWPIGCLWGWHSLWWSSVMFCCFGRQVLSCCYTWICCYTVHKLELLDQWFSNFFFSSPALGWIFYSRAVLSVCLSKTIKHSETQRFHCSLKCLTQYTLTQWMSCDFHTCRYGEYPMTMLFFYVCDE